MNQVTLIGRLVKEPELVNAGDKQKLDFTLASNTKVKGQRLTSSAARHGERKQPRSWQNT